ncbi:unnamed protein product [Euphydryas editha]|uniref:LITAF domain-containing protein n=1 Tax=Euphydryas editha TaxID=104508 RepID=A0AAU9UT31_EUPED|nr:unnamed protein product [Euphydryas editha]
MGLPPPYEPMPPHPAPPPSYYPNAPIQPPSADGPRTQVITSAPRTTTTNIKMGPGPTGTVCPTCNKSIVTRVEYVSNNRTHIVSAALCILAGCCCGCFVPYCINSCKTANHYCPQCRAFIGTHVPS